MNGASHVIRLLSGDNELLPAFVDANVVHFEGPRLPYF